MMKIHLIVLQTVLLSLGCHLTFGQAGEGSKDKHVVFGRGENTLRFELDKLGKVHIETGKSKQVYLGEDGKLKYAKDERGNRIPDFSYVGYHSGEKAIPDVKVRKTLRPMPGDMTKEIQAAIDEVGMMNPDKNGIRGAILFEAGTYRVGGTLHLGHSGVVLRGAGSGPGGTVLVATGWGPTEKRLAWNAKLKHKRTLITVGDNNEILLDQKTKCTITDDYVPVGAHSFSVESTKGYRVGDRIAVHRPGTKEWLSELQMDRIPRVEAHLQWKPSDYTFNFERRITAIEGNTITIDAPIVHSMEKKFGGGAIFKYEAKGRVTEVGIEDLYLISEFGDPVEGNPYGNPIKQERKYEDHAWDGIVLGKNSENTWVRRVRGHYFGWSLVYARGKRATVQDCINYGHASVIGGGRRYPFTIDGQLNLMQRCQAFDGRHDFANQAWTLGPNAFVDCLAIRSHHEPGPHHRYTIGSLYDNVKVPANFAPTLVVSRHGWRATQIIAYNCVFQRFTVSAPPGGVSWVIGTGRDRKGRVAPTSLYYQQVKERLGQSALDRIAPPKYRESIGEYEWAEKKPRLP